MPTDPEVLPPHYAPPPEPRALQQDAPQQDEPQEDEPRELQAGAARRIPNLGHTLLFLLVTAGVLFVTEIATFAFAAGIHLFGSETPQQLLREPRLLVPTMAISYLIASAIAWAIFTSLWRLPFFQAIRWNSAIVRRRLSLFLGLGIALSFTVQFLSNYLPIPKTLPIDDFFRTPADVWLVALFGTFLAPFFEELAFRGFLLPSLATAWDWTAGRMQGDRSAAASLGGSPSDPCRDPHWSVGALVFSCTVTSIGFAMLHADQLAHSWAPLSVLFTVSIVLCLVRLRAHSLAASTLIHATYNGAIFLLVFYATDGFRHLDKMNH